MRKCLFVLFLLVVFSFIQHADASTVVYYDGNGDGNGPVVANMLLNLAAHFDADVVARNVNQYKSGDVSTFDHGMYICGESNFLPAVFLADVAAGLRPFLWVDGNIEQLMNHLGPGDPFGFKVLDWRLGLGFDHLDYKGQLLERNGDTSFFRVEVTGDPDVYSYLTNANAKARHPHFLCGGNLCYLAENPVYFQSADDRYFVFADLLHEFYQSDIAPDHRALIRFEDLAPGIAETDLMQQIAIALIARDAPFSVDVTPVFKDPLGVYFEPDTEIHLADDPDFVATVAHLLYSGGTLIMHGVTHQHDNGMSLADWEFVIGPSNQPLPYDSAQWARDRVAWGLAEFASQGWTPDIWETPHYAASHGDYLIFDEFFDVYYEQPLAFALPPDAPGVFGEPVVHSAQLMPYAAYNSASGMAVLPENMGYISNVPGMRPADLLAKADRLLIVRDGVASFFFHHNQVDIEEVLQVVDGLLDRGFRFVEPAELLGDDDTTDDDTLDDDTTPADDDATPTDDDTGDDDTTDDDVTPGDDDDDDDDNDDGCGR